MIEYNVIQSSSPLIKTIKEGKVLVVFIHGFGGSEATWHNFTRIINESNDLKGLFEYKIYSYPTKFFKWFRKLPSLEDISIGLGTKLEYEWRDYKNVVLVCHSMGGLVCKKFLVNHVQKNYRNSDLRIKKALFYATPHNGSLVATLCLIIYQFYRQLTFLRIGSKGINKLNSEWREWGVSEKVITKYILGGKDWVVSSKSASSFPDNPNVEAVSDKDHFNIHKPNCEQDLSFIIFKIEMLKLFNMLIENSSPSDDDIINLENEYEE